MTLRVLLLIGLMACSGHQEKQDPKINGLCLVAPPFDILATHFNPIKDVGANWVAIIPYAFCSPNQPKVKFDHPSQWVGETTQGVSKAISLAKETGLKIMLKPHLWVLGQGWAGDLNYDNTEDLKLWMSSYSQYLLHFSKMAEGMQVEIVSIGTEVRHIAKEHPEYWQGLIRQVRSVYSGKLTYSANWDNYQNISFWKELDYIGVDAYFPTSESKTPGVDELINENQSVKSELEQFSRPFLKKVLFTEFGYKSVDFCTSGHWNTSDENHNINLLSQANAFDALFKTYWNEEWFAGGFAWKWHLKHSAAGGNKNREFTPQNKLAEKILKKQYEKDKKK